MFAYIECLVAWDVFQHIKVYFLPIRQKHEDIYQASSKTYKSLRSTDSVTLSDFHSAFFQFISKWSSGYRHGICSELVWNMWNRSRVRAVQNVFPLSPFFFHSVADWRVDSLFVLLPCKVKVDEKDKLNSLGSHPDDEWNNFLKHLPEFENIPPTTMKEPLG